MSVIFFKFQCLSLWNLGAQVLNYDIIQRLIILNNDIHIYIDGCLQTILIDDATARIKNIIPYFTSSYHLLIDYLMTIYHQTGSALCDIESIHESGRLPEFNKQPWTERVWLKWKSLCVREIRHSIMLDIYLMMGLIVYSKHSDNEIRRGGIMKCKLINDKLSPK